MRRFPLAEKKREKKNCWVNSQENWSEMTNLHFQRELGFPQASQPAGINRVTLYSHKPHWHFPMWFMHSLFNSVTYIFMNKSAKYLFPRNPFFCLDIFWVQWNSQGSAKHRIFHWHQDALFCIDVKAVLPVSKLFRGLGQSRRECYSLHMLHSC